MKIILYNFPCARCVRAERFSLSFFLCFVMKLTAFLRKILPLMMAVATVTVGTSNSYAANMSSDVSIITYTDFGQNMGWYKTSDASNALLTYLRNQAGGVTILRADGSVYTMPQEMIDFTGASDNGAFMALGYNATTSVQHNGVFAGSFTSAYVGEQNAVFYQGIEYRIDNKATFLHSAGGGYDGRGHDYKVTRMSKLITDVVPATLYSGSSTQLAEEAAGALLYHAGAGTMGVYTDNGESRTHTSLTGAYAYIIGGVDTIDSSVTYYEKDENGNETTICTGLNKVTTGYTSSIDEPLPFEPQQGDSGSPVFIYNTATGQYEYIAAVQSIGGGNSNYLGGVDYTKNVLDSYSKVVDTAASELHLGAVETAGDAVSSNAAYNYGMEQLVSTTPYSGKVTNSSGNVLQSFVGVKTGVNTWLDLSALKDTANWYHYDNTYLNAAPYLDGTHATDGKALSYADLFMTENLVFRSSAAQTSVVLDATVDLGIGYAQFSLAEGQANAVYNISSGGEGAYQFNHAGYVVDAGVSVHSTLTGSSAHMYEWRKVGAGALYIEGSGNNNVLLNLGGSGKTYLNRTGGYAAYNVLANTYTTVVINDINQIARDFTFGHQGGVLDMNGNSMQWDNDNAAAAEGFTIHALDELAVVANLKSGSTTTLTWTQGGQQTFLGSFADNGKDSALQFVYAGGAGARLDLHSINTHLTASGSGMVVNSGTLALSGTNTVHGLGSESGKNANRYHNALDWHYADAAADVTVNDGATFELGSHARLTGDVTVATGGTFIMREGVQHAQEYAEGSPMLVNTAAIADFYGLKGNVSLAAGATMQVAYGAGVTTNNIYSGSISGEGSVSVNLGSTASMFTLAGNNTFTGAKNLTQGVLVAATRAALGDTTANKWILGKQGTLVVLSGLSADNALSYVDASSTGTLALHENMAGVFDMSNHAGLFVGAVAGKVVEYGTAESTLGSVGGKWNLGGGGGELVVNALLNDASAALVLGNGQGLGGIVTLTNSGNRIGSITFNEGVTLSFENAAALGGANIDLSYAASLLGSSDTAAMLQLVNASSSGSVLLDRTGNADVNLSGHASLSLGSAGNTTYSGNITVAENAAYRFGGGSGTLTVTNALQKNGTNNLVVDGQTQSGGKLVLAAASELTGAISVMGYDSAKTSSQQGDMTLSFTVDNALASASSLTVHDGGIVDLGTTTQTFTNVQVLAGGVITGAEGSTLVFHMTEEKFQYGSLQLANAEKTGGANLVLAASGNSWDLLTIKQGTVFTRVDNALSSTGITRVENGGVLNMNTWNGDGFRSRTMNGNVLLADGGKLVSGDGTYSIYFNGSLDVESGATGTVEGGYWHLSAAQTNMSGGTLSYNSSQLHLAPTYAQHFGGTVDIAAGSTTFYSDGAAEDMLKHFKHINIASGKALTLEDATWNTIWQLDKLSGAGSLTWKSDTTHNKTARLIISGDGEYSGVINFNRNYAASARTHQAFLEINGQKAASGATLNMTGAHNSYASLALNAERVELGGINGNGYSHIMAGAAPADSASTSAPASSRNSTLILTGSGDYTYSGSIGSAEDSATSGVSIQMSGSGTQTFNGANLYINDVSATSGTLNISSSSLHLNGDVYLSEGANLSIGNAFTLGSGTTVHVVDSANSGMASFNSQLILGGGTLNFDALGLSTGTPMLDLLNGSKVQYANGTSSLVISLSNTSNLKVDNSGWASSSTYKLSYDDWSGIDASSITLADMPHLNATFITSADGLSVQLVIPSTSNVWAGTSSSFNWTPGLFGGAYDEVTGTAVFDDSTNAYKTVSIASSPSGNAVKPENIIFDSTSLYTVDATKDATLTAKNLIQRGTGSTLLQGAVTVTNSVNIAYGKLITTTTEQLAGSISGAGSLGIDWGEGVSGSLNISHIGTLQLMSGTYNLNAGSVADNIVVDSGATLSLAGGVVLNTQLTTSGAIVMGAGSSIAGNMTLSGATTVNIGSGEYEIKSVITGAGQSLTKCGVGTLVLGNSSIALGQLNVAEGGAQIGADIGAGISEISLAGGSFLKFNWGGGLTDTKVLMAEGSSLLVVNGGVGTVRPDVVLTGVSAVLQGGYYNPSCTLGGSISAAARVSSTLKLTNDESHTWTVSSSIADGEGTVAVSVENAGTVGDKNVDPNVKLTGNNTYSGGTTIKAGTLTAASTNALGTGNVEIAGGTLTLAQDLTVSSLSGKAGTLNLNGKTLTVGNGSATYAARSADSSTYSGDFGSAGSITKVGSNTQVFESSDMLLENVSVQGGTLNLNDVASVSGDIYVASGATLVTGGDAINLGAGQTLTAEAGSSITLAGLTLNGGTLSLDLGTPTGAPEETPTLTIAQAVAGSGGVITLVGDLSSLQTAQLMLAKGDWSHFAGGGLTLESLSLLGGGSTPLNYSLMADGEGLYLSMVAVSESDSNIWAGTEAAHEWDADSYSVYGTGALTEKAIFDASAAVKTVTISGTVSTGTVEIVGGGYTFEGSGSIAAGGVSASGGGASTINSIALSGEVDGTISVNGTELTIVQLTPTNPSAPIALSNGAKLTIGDDSHRYGAFSGKVTGDAGSQLHLYTTQVSGTYWQQDGTVQLLDGSTVQDVYIHGDLALNIIAGSQATIGDKFTNLQGANLHMDAGSQLVVRAEEGTGITPTTGNIVLGGDLSIVAYSPVTTATSITSNFTQDADATTKLIKKQTLDNGGKDSTGSITLSGNIDVDAIEVQAGTLNLTGSSIASAAYSVASGATLAFSGAADSAAASSALVNATGAGNVSISGQGRGATTIELSPDSQSQATGALTLNSLTLDMNGSVKSDSYDLSSYTSMSWNDVQVKYHGTATTFNNVTVGSSGAWLMVQDVNGDDIASAEAISFSGTTTLNGDMHITNGEWKYKINIEALTGAGDLNIGISSQTTRPAHVTIGQMTGYTGGITVSGDQTVLNINAIAESALDSVNVSGGTVNFNGASEIGSATVTGGTVNINATAEIESLTISGGNVKSTAATFGKQGDVITLAGGTFELNRNEANAEQTLLSALEVSNASATAESTSTSVLKNAQGQNNMIRTLSAVEIAAHNTLVLQQTGWNTIWNINELTGEGTLSWVSSTNHSQSSRLILSEDNSFSGMIELNRSAVDYTWVDNGAYQAYIVLADDGAAKDATLSLQGAVSGANKNNVATLVINTDNAAVQGIIGNELSHIYSGEVRESVTRNDSAPGTTVANTLTIAGTGDYTFAGTVGTDADTERLSLAMTGEGKQTFSGQAYVGNVSVSNGELVLSRAKVDGSVTVSGGALNMTGSSYTLGSGDVLSVLTGTEHAVQLGGLTLSGGELVFDASMLSADTSALRVGTVSLGEGTSSQQITFNNIDNLDSGRYLLSDSWTVVDGLSFTTNNLLHGEASVVMQDGSLYLDYTAAQYYTWTGAADGNWNYSSNNWDNTPDIVTDDSVRFIANRVAIFETDANVTVSEAVSSDELIVRNGATLNLTETAALTVNSIEVAEGSTLAFKTEKAGYTVGNISGTGTVELSLTTNYENSLRLEGFDGEVYVKSGRFDLFDATAVYAGAENAAENQVAQLGGKLHLGAGVNMQIESGKTVIVNADMQLDGRTEVHQNGGAKLTVNGDVTGDGTWVRKGGGTLTFTGSVTLGRFEGAENNNFNGAVSLSELAITGGTSTFSSEVSIDTATVSGGTVHFNGTSEIDSATVSAGTVNFNAASELTSATVTGGTVNFNATAEIDAITISGGNVKSTAATFGKQGGIITLAGGTFELNRNVANAEQTLLSVLLVSNESATAEAPSSSVLKNAQATNNMIRTLRAVEIAAHNTLVLQQNSWNTIWNIEDLTGEGNLLWSSTTNHNTTSRLVLSGDGSDFFGNVTVNRSYSADARRYQAFVEIASDKALQNSVITLNCTSTGNKADAITSLAINTANAQVGGLQSDAYAHLYAGAALVNSGSSKPASSVANTLTIAGTGDYTFAGTVGSDADTARLNLSMIGSGTQTFSGQTYVGNVSVSNGTLVLSNADVNGSVTVSGGMLNMTGSTYTLGSGDVLSVLIRTENAVQLGGMTLSGGQMLFDASLLTADSAALSLGSAAEYAAGTTQTVTLDFSNLSGALANGTYKLASGDWSGENNTSLTYTGMGSATFNATADGLYLVYSNDGVYTWVGGASDINWSSANWDIVPDADASNNLSFATGKDVIFNTDATAQVTNGVSAGTVYILNGADVTFDMNGDGASLTAESLVVGNGKLTLSEHVSTTSISHIAVSEAGTLIIHQPQALGGSNSVLGKVSGEGTLVIDLASAGTVVYATGQGDAANLGNFTGTVDVTKGWLIVGNTNSSGGGALADFNAGKVIVRDGSILSTHFGVGKYDNDAHTIFASDIDLMNGATLLNIDGSTRYTGNIRFNVENPLAANSTYNANGTVTIDQHWQKKLEFSGLLEGDGTVKLANTNNEEHAIYMITGENNTFAGTFELFDDNGTGESDIIELRLGTETAAQYADIKLSSTSAKSYLMLDSNVTINGLYGVVDAQNAVQAQSAARTLTVSVGDFGGSLQDSTGTLSLIKQGSGTLTLRGANTYTGTTSITGGTLELAGAVSMAENGGEITVNSGSTLLLNTSQTLTLNNDISGQGTIHKKSGQEVVLNGDVTASLVNVADGNHQTVNAGTLSFAGDTVKVGKLYLAYGSVNVGSTDGSATFMSLEQLESGDSEENNSTVSLTVRDGSTLSVTGNNSTGGTDYKSASFLLAEWNASATLNVEGSLLVQNAKVLLGDDAVVININGGTMAVQGITHARVGYNAGLELNVTDGGKLILGASGIDTYKPVTATLGEGTVGMSAASTTIAENVTLNSAEGTTFDTTQYTYETNADGVATDIVRGTEGGDLVLSGDVNSAEGVDASMKVVGAGTLHVAGTAAVRGDVTVEAGATLAVSSGSTAMAGISSADDSAAATISGGVNLSHGENSVRITGAGMDVTEISNSLIELQQGVSLNLSNVHLAADSSVMGAGAAAATSGVMLLEGEMTRNTVALESVSVAIALEQNATRGADAAVDSVGSKIMMLDSSAFAYNSLTGSLTVEFSAELAAMLLQGGYDAVGLSFTGSEMVTDMTILGMYDGIAGSTQGIFATDAGSSAVVYFSTDIIPEPATGTLSLLALAALAMRRRRR